MCLVCSVNFKGVLSLTLGGPTGVQVTPAKLIFAFLLFFYPIWSVKLFVNNLYTFRDARGTCADI